MKWLQRTGVLAVVVGAALVVTAGAARADVTGRQVVTSAFTVQPGQGWDTVATCPAGKVSTGGGYSHGSTSGLVIDVSRPATNGQGWHVHVLNTTASARTITAYAVCGVVPARQVVTSAFTVQPGQGWDTVATCPAGKVSTGGGYSHGSTSGLVIDVSRPATNGQGWHVHVLNTTASARTITAYAVCATTPGRQVVTSAFTVQPGQGWDTVATCPAGKVSTGGGHSHGSTSGLVIDVSRPATNGQGWHVHVLNTTASARTITAYAVCATGS